eukprot:51337-Amphidinium_carterae.2
MRHIAVFCTWSVPEVKLRVPKALQAQIAMQVGSHCMRSMTEVGCSCARDHSCPLFLEGKD